MQMLFMVSMGLLGLSLLLVLIGFSTVYWMDIVSHGVHYGLWRICSYSSSLCISIEAFVAGGTAPGHAHFARFTGFFQIFCSIGSLANLALFLFKSAKQVFVKTAMYCTLAAGIAGFFGAVIFIAVEKSGDVEGDRNVLWSGILVIIGAFMEIGAGICILLPVQRGQLEYAV